MARTLDCPCPPQPITCVGDATGFGISKQSTMQSVGRTASEISYKGALDAVNNVTCAGNCRKEISKTPIQKTTLEEGTRLWWTLFIVVECHVQCETTITVACVVDG